MKKLILSAIFLLGISASGFSQERNKRDQFSPEERAQKMTDMLDNRLSLSADQKSKIYRINLDRAKEMGKFEGQRGTKDLSKRKATYQANEEKILRVLNKNQKESYKKLKADRMAKMKNHKGKHKIPSRK